MFQLKEQTKKPEPRGPGFLAWRGASQLQSSAVKPVALTTAW